MNVLLMIISLCIPPLGLPMAFLGIGYDKRKWKIHIISLAIAMAAFAYCYTPIHATDLTRYFAFIEGVSTKSFVEAFSYETYGTSGQGLFVFSFMCWIAGKCGDVHLIPAFTVFVVYYIGLFVACKVAEDSGVKRKRLILFLLFLILTSNFYAIVNNIRNVFAFSIVGFAMFRELYLKRRNVWTYLMYLLPVFIHPTALLFILIRLSLSLAGKMRAFLIVLIVLVRPIIGFIFPYVGYLPGGVIGGLGSNVIIKAHNYFFDTSSAWGLVVQQSKTETLFKILYISISIIITICAFLLLQERNQRIQSVKHNVKNDINEKPVLFVMCVGLMAIACAPMLRPEYWRFAAIAILFSGCVYFPAQKIWTTFSWRQLILNSIFLFPLLCFPLWMRYMISSSEMMTVVGKAFISSPILVTVIDIANIVFG